MLRFCFEACSEGIVLLAFVFRMLWHKHCLKAVCAAVPLHLEFSAKGLSARKYRREEELEISPSKGHLCRISKCCHQRRTYHNLVGTISGNDYNRSNANLLRLLIRTPRQTIEH